MFGGSENLLLPEVSSISLRLGIGGSLAISYGGIRVSSVGQRSSSARDSLVSSIDTGGRLAAEGKVAGVQ